MNVPKTLISAFKKERSFLLATHVNPDGDALGSCLALAEALAALGKKVFLYDRDPVPESYRFLPGHRRFQATTSKASGNEARLVLLDCNSPERADLDGTAFKKSAVIDHHETESDYGDIRWVERKAAATGLMVFYLIKALGIPLTRTMATNLYTAIAVDTGTFRYSNTSPVVFSAAAEIVKAGASPGTISEHLYERWKKNRFDLLNLSLRTLEINDGIALLHVTKDMFRETGTAEADTENFANVPRIIDSVMISTLIKEIGSGQWKVSMRSKGRVNVARIAEAFGGGGHRNAAGFRMKADLNSVKRAVLESGRGLLRKA